MIGYGCSLTKRTTTMLPLNPIILFVILLLFQSFLWQDESKEAVLAGVDSLSEVQNKSNGELFQIHFFSFHGCFSLSLTQGALFSQEKNFPFGWKNIFFLRIPSRRSLHGDEKHGWKRKNGLLPSPLFTLFGRLGNTTVRCLFVRPNALKPAYFMPASAGCRRPADFWKA